ncbi:hypothetical protein [Streptomyces sp. NPDC006971]|uniref:hypothetical protein n=1 Tax=Streptomyces sp. NPDC006971 TaxID=3154784 RepID=UPI0033C05BEC
MVALPGRRDHLDDHGLDAARVGDPAATAAGHLRHPYEFLAVDVGADRDGQERHQALGVREPLPFGEQAAAGEGTVVLVRTAGEDHHRAEPALGVRRPGVPARGEPSAARLGLPASVGRGVVGQAGTSHVGGAPP